MFQIKRYKFLSRKHGIIEKNYSNENCRVQKDLFINLISLNGIIKIKSRSRRLFKMEHSTFDSRI